MHVKHHGITFEGGIGKVGAGTSEAVSETTSLSHYPTYLSFRADPDTVESVRSTYLEGPQQERAV